MGTTGFVLTPHKLSVCILLQACALPSTCSPPLPVLSMPVRHKLSLFILQILKAHDNFLEPSFEELGFQLRLALEEGAGLLVNQVVNRLVGFVSPEDLFTFALGLRDLLATVLNPAPEVALGEEEPLLIESNSLLGHFLRRCILAFNLLSFEGMCKLLTDLDTYRQRMLTISGANRALQSSIAKNMDDVDIHDEDHPNDDEDYFGYGNLERQNSMSDMQKPISEAREHKAFEDTFQVLGAMNEAEFAFEETRSHDEVQDRSFTLAFGDLPNKVNNSSEGLVLRTNDQVESYMRELADTIEREVGLFGSEDVEVKLNQVEKLAPDFFKVHYLRYLNCLSNGDYPAAVDNLHRYFDYSAGKGALNGTNTSGATTGRFQAGLLALGSMHARFGHTSEALQALNEAVGIAQQNSDDSCLAHALAALCHMVSEVGVPGDANNLESTLPGLDAGNGPSLSVQEQLLLLLECCLRRAVELRLPHLVAFSRLVFAKFSLKFVRRSPLLNGPRTSEQLVTSPLDVHKTLKLSPYLLGSITTSSATLGSAVSTNVGVGGLQRPGATGSANNQGLGMPGTISTFGGGGSARGSPILGSILQLAGTAHLLRAASWELYGSTPMARISALIHATCYRDVASADDLSLAYVKLAQYLATHKSYDEAYAALDIASKKFPLVAKSRVRAAHLRIVHERALHRGEIKIAQAACDMLAALSSPVQGVDIELKIDAAHRHARTLLAVGQFSEAACVAHSLFDTCYKYKMQLESIMALLLLADIHKKAESVVSGLPYALASLTLSKSFNLDLVHAAAMVTLAELWLGLGPSRADQALSLLHQCMTMVLGHGGRELRARTYLAVAQCHLCSRTYSVHADPQAVCEPLQAAAEELEVLEDNEQASEVFYLQARVFHELGAMEERDHAAALFRKYTLALQAAQTKESLSLPH